jgi:hypothetical protein
MDTTRTLASSAVAGRANCHKNTVLNYVRRGIVSPITLSDSTGVIDDDVRVIRQLVAASRRPAEGASMTQVSSGSGVPWTRCPAPWGIRPSTSRWTFMGTSCQGAGAPIGSGRSCLAEVVEERDRSTRLSLQRTSTPSFVWWPGTELNRRHRDFQSPPPPFYAVSARNTPAP